MEPEPDRAPDASVMSAPSRPVTPASPPPGVEVCVEPGLYELHRFAGASPGPALLIELPHGATRAAHYAACRAQLHSPLPEQLEHFFFVNTDVGCFSVACALAVEATRLCPTLSVVVLRSLIPRTFVDCNRVLDAGDDATGGLTPAIPPYVTDRADHAQLRAMHRAYTERAAALYHQICGAGGLALMLHTYAPRAVPIESIDERIVERLHAAYEGPAQEALPLRPEIDFITRPPSGASLIARALVDRLADAWRGAGFSPTIDATYPLHPATLAHHFAMVWPGQTLCLEIRRDLIVERFTPFAEMHADPHRVAALVRPIAPVIIEHLRAGALAC